MDTATRQDWIIGHTRTGRAVYAIAGAEGDGDPGEGDKPKGGEGDKPKEFTPIQSQDDLDRIITKRLARERERFGDYEALKDKASKFDQLEDDKKSEIQKASDRATQAETRASDAELRALRLEVAMDKGLTPTQAKRLVGKTKEELEADADELIESFKGDGEGDPTKPKPPGRPKESLRGGGDPTQGAEEMNPRELAKGLSRY
jgi:hypothetical protein